MQEVVMQEKALVRWKPFLIGGGMILFSNESSCARGQITASEQHHEVPLQ